MQLIKQGSKGPDVAKWQQIVGVSADGNFGPGTHKATVEWQKAHKLVFDGVVGPATWSAALGTPMPVVKQKTPGFATDVKAYEIAKKAAPELTERQRQYVLTVARGEGFYGLGWGNPSAATIAASQKYGLTGYEGKDSNNWGATQGSGSAGSFRHVDYHADGSPYTANYKRWATPEEGFNDMKRIILNGGKRKEVGAKEIKAAIDAGDLRQAVFAQHANGYFELHPEKYLAAVLKNYNILSVNTEWKNLFSENSGLLKKIFTGVGVAIALIVGAYGYSKLRS